jgi:hypothetical protein
VVVGSPDACLRSVELSRGAIIGNAKHLLDLFQKLLLGIALLALEL